MIAACFTAAFAMQQSVRTSVWCCCVHACRMQSYLTFISRAFHTPPPFLIMRALNRYPPDSKDFLHMHLALARLCVEGCQCHYACWGVKQSNLIHSSLGSLVFFLFLVSHERTEKSVFCISCSFLFLHYKPKTKKCEKYKNISL